MRNRLIVALCPVCALLLSSCSPRDVLSRRLAADLIRGSSSFTTPQQFWLRTGVVSNKEYLEPEYLLLQHHGWTSATTVPCPPQLAPPPCWDVVLTPSGVETIRGLITPEDAGKPSFNVPAARRELLEITGISKQGNTADVDFTWKWAPLNEVGAAIYSADLHYRSTAGFRYYDDGWRLLQSAPRSGQALDEALKNAEPTQ
jgi:hypothetical protein